MARERNGRSADRRAGFVLKEKRSKPRAAGFSGFTLIELLVVVAIISILAAIALPNFLEAQTRAKVSRVLADMGALTVGLETYCVDHNDYPPRRSPWTYHMPEFSRQYQDMRRMTTPIAYLTSLPIDVFDRAAVPRKALIEYLDPLQTTWFVRKAQGESRTTYYSTTNWLLLSVGPDGYIGVSTKGVPGGYPAQPLGVALTVTRAYDPTNGTVSVGNIFRFAERQDPQRLLRVAR